MTSTKEITAMDCKRVADTLTSARKLLTVDHSATGQVNSNASTKDIDKSMSMVDSLIDFSGSIISKTVATYKTARDIVSNSEAISTLEQICIDDINNGYFDSNVKDGQQLLNVSDSSTRYFRATPSWVKSLTASDVLELISDIVFDDTLRSIMKAHSKEAYSRMIKL